MAKHVINGHIAFDAVSASAAQTTAETSVGQLDKLSYHCKFTQAATGTFVVEAKNGDKDSWYALYFGAPLAISAETDVSINLLELPFQKVRLIWGGDGTNAGTLTVVTSAKAVGA